MPYPNAINEAAFRTANLLLVPPPSEANVLFDGQALVVDRPIAQYLAIAVACNGQVLNMNRRGHNKAAWRAGLLQMLLGYYQWPPADAAGHYLLTSQEQAAPSEPSEVSGDAPSEPDYSHHSEEEEEAIPDMYLPDGRPNPAYLRHRMVAQEIIDSIINASKQHQSSTTGKKDVGVSWLLSQTFFPDLKVSFILALIHVTMREQ